MKNSNKTLIGVLAVVALLAVWFISASNALVTLNNEVDSQWATVETKLQRRQDLIPNLVGSVKGIMSHEEEVFTNIADARAKLGGANSVNEKVEASSELEGALSRLLVVMENYPELKANENVNRLMDELAGTENRISVERDRYNEVVKVYNNKVQRFPGSIIANIKGYQPKTYFRAQEGSDVAPTVDFQS